MSVRLFRREGFAVYPASRIAYLILLVAAAFLVYAFWDIDSHSHSVSDTVRNWVFMAIIVAAVVYTVGLMTSSKSRK